MSTRHGTLTANVVSELDLDVDEGEIAVLNKSDTAWIYARADGTDPTVSGNDTLSVPPGYRRIIDTDANARTALKLISNSAASYEVEW